jgi:hypothetical protein
MDSVNSEGIDLGACSTSGSDLLSEGKELAHYQAQTAVTCASPPSLLCEFPNHRYLPKSLLKLSPLRFSVLPSRSFLSSSTRTLPLADDPPDRPDVKRA